MQALKIPQVIKLPVATDNKIHRYKISIDDPVAPSP